jgi:hypothetical protein
MQYKVKWKSLHNSLKHNFPSQKTPTLDQEHNLCASWKATENWCSTHVVRHCTDYKLALNVNLSLEKILYTTGRKELKESDQSSWLQIERSWFDSRRYQIFREVVGLERGPISLVSITGELLGRKSSGFSLEIEFLSMIKTHGDTIFPVRYEMNS